MKCHAFGYAGSSDNAFISLNAGWPRALSLRQYIYPGRGSRVSADFAASLGLLARQAAQEIAAEQPVVLLGYSLGALVAYETARVLRSKNKQVAALVVCAMNAPHCQQPSRQVHQMDLPELTRYLADLGGTPPEILRSTELMAWFAPAIQADYRLLDGYLPPSEGALDCPIVALYGEDDPLTTLTGIKEWRRCTRASFECASLPGGHFFLQNQPETMTSLLFNLLPSITLKEISV
ncbi:TPA: thioesterase II family protein [Serratia marcescens]